MPYYQDDYITLYNGDNRDLLPLLPQHDLLLTDPPYGIGLSGNTIGGAVGAPLTDFGPITWDQPLDRDHIELVRASGAQQIIWGGNHLGELPKSSCWLVWDKDNGTTAFADCELAWTNLPGAVRMFRYRWNGYLQADPMNKEKRVHPTQKPLPLMRWCIDRCKDIKTIIDPFAGCGSTLIAAKQLGLTATGIELDTDYCERAVQRFETIQLRLKLEG